MFLLNILRIIRELGWNTNKMNLALFNSMTRNYIYIEAGREIDETSRFFRVSIGTSKQSNRDYLFLLAYSMSHNYFLELNSSSVADYLLNIAESLGGSRYVCPLDVLRIRNIKIRDLVRAIKAKSSISDDYLVRKNSENQRAALDSAYFAMKKMARNLTLPSEAAVKNLK